MWPKRARIPFADLGERVELLARDHALRDLHAQHRASYDLALSVGAAEQAERPPLVRRHLAPLVLLQHDDELVDIGFVGERQPRAPVSVHRLVCMTSYVLLRHRPAQAPAATFSPVDCVDPPSL